MLELNISSLDKVTSFHILFQSSAVDVITSCLRKLRVANLEQVAIA